MLARTLRYTALTLTLGAVGAPGCQQKVSTAEAGLAQAATVQVTGAEAGEKKPRKRRRGRRRGRRWSKSPVYVDGQFQGMLKYGELPPTLPTLYKHFEGDEGKVARRFAWTDYLEALGVDVAEVAAIHFYGGRDIVCVVDGDELRRVGDTFQFSFTRGTAGWPRLEIPVDGIEYNSYVDKLRGVAVYVDETPPSYDTYDGLEMPDGTPVEEGYPYAKKERHGGTRVYLDGELVEVFHRRALDPDRQRETGYDLADTLAGFGVPVEELAHVQLLGARDEIALELAPGEMSEGVGFDLPRGSRGRIEVGEAGDRPIEAVLLYSRTAPADRGLPTTPTGSNDTQFGKKKSNDSGERLAARDVQSQSGREILD